MSAQIAHGHPLRLRALDQAPNCSLIENKFQSVLIAEFLGELTGTGFEHLRRELVSLNLEAIKHALRLAHQRGGEQSLAQPRPSQIILVLAEQIIKHRE